MPVTAELASGVDGGPLAALAAILVYLLLTEWDIPYPLAVGAGAVAAFVLGGIALLAVAR